MPQHLILFNIVSYDNKCSQTFVLSCSPDEHRATLNVTVHSPPGSRKVSGSCSFNFTVQKQNTLQLCCSNTATLCYPRISVNGSVVADNKPGCASYRLTPSNEQFRATINFSYSVCDQNSYINYISCTMKPPPGKLFCFSLIAKSYE